MSSSVIIYTGLLKQSPLQLLEKKMNNVKQLLLNINKHIIQFLIDKPTSQNIIETLCHRSCKAQGKKKKDIWIIWPLKEL